MKKIIIPAVLIILLASVVLAGGIRGILKEDSRPVEGAKVTVFPTRNDTTYSGITDRHGSYRIYVPSVEKCSLLVTIDSINTNKIPVRIYRDTKHQNLILTRTDSTISLRGE